MNKITNKPFGHINNLIITNKPSGHINTVIQIGDYRMRINGTRYWYSFINIKLKDHNE